MSENRVQVAHGALAQLVFELGLGCGVDATKEALALVLVTLCDCGDGVGRRDAAIAVDAAADLIETKTGKRTEAPS